MSVGEKYCRDCAHCAMDMDMEPYCSHPDVLKTNSFGSNTNVVRGAKLGDGREKLPHFDLCGQEARLFSPRNGRERDFHLNEFHSKNCERAKKDFHPEHSLLGLVACVQEEVGELASAVLGVTGEKARKSHLTDKDILDAVADAITYLSLIASKVGCHDLETLLGETFNMVSERAGSTIRVRV